MRLRFENKILLRPITLADAPRFVRWLRDPHVNKFLGRKAITLKEERLWIRTLPKRMKTNPIFAIDTAEGIHIGSCGFHASSPRDRSAELGILIGDKNYWNGGYGTDAMRAILEHGFIDMKLHRIWLKVYAYNPRAVHVYEKIGFKHEGIAREAVKFGTRYHDEFYMGILASEWKKYAAPSKRKNRRR